MEMFYFQIAGIVTLIGLGVYWFYNKKKVTELNEQLIDKKIVINELAEHANKMEQEISSVGSTKPIKPKKQKVVKAKVEKVVKPKKEKVVKAKVEKVSKPKKTKK